MYDEVIREYPKLPLKPEVVQIIVQRLKWPTCVSLVDKQSKMLVGKKVSEAKQKACVLRVTVFLFFHALLVCKIG